MNTYFGIFSAIFCSSVLSSTGANLINIWAFASSEYDVSDFHDEACPDRMFDKYLKDAEPEYDKYLDSADDVPLPDSESEVDDYLDSLDPLAKGYIDNLEPYAEDYIDNLNECLN